VRKIQWAAVANMILKDGLLTIDMKNNRIIQQYIDDAKTKVDQQEFNEFCRQHLVSSI